MKGQGRGRNRKLRQAEALVSLIVAVGSVVVTITPDDCAQLQSQAWFAITVSEEITLRPCVDHQRTDISHNGYHRVAGWMQKEESEATSLMLLNWSLPVKIVTLSEALSMHFLWTM